MQLILQRGATTLSSQNPYKRDTDRPGCEKTDIRAEEERYHHEDKDEDTHPDKNFEILIKIFISSSGVARSGADFAT